MPVVGQACIISRQIFVGDSLTSIQQAVKRARTTLQGGMSMSIFPEGTRSKDGKLGEFKPGCLKVAEKAECPIAVFALQGTEKIMKNFPWRKTKVSIDMLRVIQPEEFAEKTTVDISDEIRSEMLKKLGE